MSDLTKNQRKKQDDYNLFKKTIEEIVGKSKIKRDDKEKKMKKKKDQEPRDRSHDMMKYYFGLQKFAKSLAAVTLDKGKKESKESSKSKRSKASSSGESESCKFSKSSSSTSKRARNKNNSKERPKEGKRDEYATDELSDTESTQGTESLESYSQVSGSKYDNAVPKVDSKMTVSEKKENESSSVAPIKKKCTLSASEMAIIKELCRDLIKKEEKPKKDKELVQKSELSIIEVEEEEEYYNANSVQEALSDKAEENVVKMENKNEEKGQEYKIEPENNLEQECDTEKTIINTKTEYSDMENTQVINRVNFELPIFGELPIITLEETPEAVIEENTIKEYNKESDDIIKPFLVNGEFTLIKELKEEGTKKSEEKIEKVHLEIVTTETVKEEADEWKQTIEEKVVIEKTVKVNLEEAEVMEKGIKKEVFNEPQEVFQLNMSDDDLIRKTLSEMEEINKEYMIHKTSPDGENYYSYSENGDVADGNGNKNNTLEKRIEELQQQINYLREQLEVTKRQNEEEAKEIQYLSAVLDHQESSVPRCTSGGLDWDEWELKEMVRERLQQRRLAAAQDYQAKLRVVDALCSAEMGRLEDTLQTLLPLNAAVSSWDPPPVPPQQDLGPSWQMQDYFFEVVASMNVSSSDQNGASGTISTNGENPCLTEHKAEGQ